MRRILVTAISGDIANGILKVLKSDEHILYGCDINEFAAGMDLVHAFWQSRYAVEDGYVEELLAKCNEYKITHLIPSNEREIEIIGRERSKFEEIGVKLVVQSDNILNICLDKYLTALELSELGISVPLTYLNRDEIEDKSGKYICKPRKSNGSKNIFLYLRDTDSHQAEDFKDCVLQEYIESEEEYTVGVFKQDNCINTIAFRRELKNGYTNQVILVKEEALEQLAMRVAAAMDLKGFFNIQLRKLGTEYYIFEINPRISGTVRFRHMLGYTDVLWWLDMLDGKKVDKYVCPYQEAVGVRELNEKFLKLHE